MVWGLEQLPAELETLGSIPVLSKCFIVLVAGKETENLYLNFCVSVHSDERGINFRSASDVYNRLDYKQTGS